MSQGTVASRTLALAILIGAAAASHAQWFADENFETIRYGSLGRSIPGWTNTDFRYFVDYDPTGYTWERPIFSKYSLCFPEFSDTPYPATFSFRAGKNFSYNYTTSGAAKFLVAEAWIYCPSGYTGSAAYGLTLVHPTAGTQLATVGIDAATGRAWLNNYFGDRVYSTAVSASSNTWHRLSLQLDYNTGQVNAAIDNYDLGLTAVFQRSVGSVSFMPMFVSCRESAPRIHFDDYRVGVWKKKAIFQQSLQP